MAHLVGHSSGVQYIQTMNPATADGSVSVGGPTTGATTDGTGTNIIDGTPVRVGLLAFAAAAGLWAFKIAGLRFNVGVSA